MKLIVLYVSNIILLFLSLNNFVQSQEGGKDSIIKKHGYFSSEYWCCDESTISWAEHNIAFSGLRFILEPRFGYIYYDDVGEFESDMFVNVPRLGAETNLYRGYIALQGCLFLPSKFTLSERSEVVVLGALKSNDRSAKLNIGWSIGLSFFNGILSAGGGVLYFSKNDFSIFYRKTYCPSFFYINLQMVTTLKEIIKISKYWSGSK